MTVRKLPLGLSISVAVHLTAVAWLATAGTTRVPPAPHTELVHVEILPPPEPEPMAIALLDEPVVAPPVAPPAALPAPHRAAAPRPAAAEIRAGAAHDEVAAPVEPPAQTGSGGPRSKLFTMRGPAIEKGLSQAFVDDIVARAKPLAPAVEPSGELVPSGGGRHRSDQGSFRVDVDKDGTAHLSDAPNLHVGIALPRPRDIGNAISQWAEDPYRDTQAAKRQRLGEYKGQGDDTKTTSSNIVPVPIISGGFDATDALMRRHGQDPYASKKLKVLDATRDERAEIGDKYRREQLIRASQLIKAAADQLWRSGLDVAAKKRQLFELWDDCAEAGAPELVDAGARARAYLVGFVNAKLPAGSPSAFSAAELEELNAHRHSHLVFAPYHD